MPSPINNNQRGERAKLLSNRCSSSTRQQLLWKAFNWELLNSAVPKEGSGAKTASDTRKNATFQVQCETLNIHKMINRKYFVIIPFCPRGKDTTSVLLSNFDSHIGHCTQVFAKASLSWLISCCFTQEGNVIQYMKCKLSQPPRVRGVAAGVTQWKAASVLKWT